MVMMAMFVILVVVNQTSGNAAEPASSITNLIQLSQMVDTEQAFVGSINIEGTVWWSSESEGRVILNDDSGTVQVELDFPCQMPLQGARVSLAGKCTMVKNRDVIKLSSIPVVENDGLHPMTEKSGDIYLEVGLHPIHVGWFNRTDKFGLEVAYEGPNIPRQKIPDGVLFRSQFDPEKGVTNLINGLNYRCCEGLWWSWMPNLYHLPTVKTGEVNNFDIAVRSRNEHVGLQFNGYIQITNAGLYTFHTTSDDGSRLFIGDPSLRIAVHGTAPLPPSSQITDGSGPEANGYRWSEIEGIVISVNRLQDVLEFELATTSGRKTIKVADNSNCSFILVPKNRIRTIGVSHNMLLLDGKSEPGEFFVQRWTDIDQRYITPDLWSIFPLLSISNAVGACKEITGQPIVHLRGQVHPAESDKPAFLDDGSGRILLESAVPDDVVSQTAEVLGRLNNKGTNSVLRCGFFKRFETNSGSMATLPVLTTVEQVQGLSADELKQGWPVKLRGVITSVLQGDAAVLQDTTRGIYIDIGKPIALQPGDYCEVEGFAISGEFSPYIHASHFDIIGEGPLPNPVFPTWDQVINGNMHCQYVELEGVVTLIDSNTITLLTRDGRIRVQLDSMAAAFPPSYLNALIRLRGCLFADWDKQARRVKVGDIRLNQQWVSLVQPAPLDPFAISAKRVGELLKFDPQAGALQRVKVSGQIIYQGNEGCFLMDGENGLRFVYAGDPTAHVCDLVEVVGFPDLAGPSPVLREAVVRRFGLAEVSNPRKLKPDELVRDEYDSTLVQVDGVLLGTSSTPGGDVLEIQTGLRRFMAVVDDKTGLKGKMVAGSRLELTGVYEGEGGDRVLGRPIDSFRLLLNSGFDIRVLSNPPWWTLRRLLSVVGILAGILIAALLWIKQLKAKVAQKTLQLEAQIQKRQRAERQREIEQERSRVAQDLHDDLGAGLTRINMLTSLADSPAVADGARKQYLADLKTMARDMVTSLDEIVWAVNPRNDTLASLVGYFGAHAQGLLTLASVKWGLDVAEELPDIPLDSKFRHEIFMIFKEAITNVIRHSGATKAWLRVRVESGVLILEVEDNGCGFIPNPPMLGADGIANMRERLNKLGGSCKIQSQPGKGTAIRFEAPLSKTSPSL
jgi:signal transduction histidine kinase